MVFALPGEPGLTELSGDFKIHFQDRQGDFYWSVCYLGSLLLFSACTISVHSSALVFIVICLRKTYVSAHDPLPSTFRHIIVIHSLGKSRGSSSNI